MEAAVSSASKHGRVAVKAAAFSHAELEAAQAQVSLQMGKHDTDIVAVVIPTTDRAFSLRRCRRTTLTTDEGRRAQIDYHVWKDLPTKYSPLRTSESRSR
jgi:hypothetical protein